MGYYTGLRFDAELSEFGRSVVVALDVPVDSGERWQHVVETIKGCEGFALFSKLYRSRFIPHGCSVEGIGGRGWKKHRNKLKGQRWRVACALKNYDNEIEVFLEDVLPRLISGPVLVSVKTEEALVPDFVVVSPSDVDACQRCASVRVWEVGASVEYAGGTRFVSFEDGADPDGVDGVEAFEECKPKGANVVTFNEHEPYKGEPGWVGVRFCADCGQIQGTWPVVGKGGGS